MTHRLSGAPISGAKGGPSGLLGVPTACLDEAGRRGPRGANSYSYEYTPSVTPKFPSLGPSSSVLSSAERRGRSEATGLSLDETKQPAVQPHVCRQRLPAGFTPQRTLQGRQTRSARRRSLRKCLRGGHGPSSTLLMG